jgi:hypothetical protein
VWGHTHRGFESLPLRWVIRRAVPAPVSGLLVETHIALWALGDPARLTDTERALLVDPSVDRRLSPMSIWVLSRGREFAAYGVRMDA